MSRLVRIALGLLPAQPGYMEFPGITLDLRNGTMNILGVKAETSEGFRVHLLCSGRSNQRTPHSRLLLCQKLDLLRSPCMSIVCAGLSARASAYTHMHGERQRKEGTLSL